VGVGVEGDGYARVTQKVLHELGVDVALEKERGARVAEVVECDSLVPRLALFRSGAKERCRRFEGLMRFPPLPAKTSFRSSYNSPAAGEEVLAVLHHVPEDEDFKGGYEDETMTGVPNGVRITGSGEDSKEAALDHLVGGLMLLGFRGALVVDDVTEPGRNDNYRVEIPGDL
jgi:hypothetical protein